MAARSVAAPAEEQSSDVKYWLAQIEAQQKARRNWYERAKKINDRYKKEKQLTPDDPHSMNMLWSNVETIKPALYAKSPNAKVSRRYRDKDRVGRWAAITLERCLGYGLDAYDFDYTMRSCVQDYVLPACGQVWVSYKPQIGVDGKLAWENVNNSHVHYKDFLHGPARTWDEVPWVSKCAYLTKKEVEADPRFKASASKLSFEEKRKPGSPKDEGGIKKAAIWEIWDKSSAKIYFVSESCPVLLCEPQDPFLKFETFFPCPRPLLGTTTTDDLIPTPDFILYQNQADEIDALTAQINELTKALRVVGVYDSASGAPLAELFGPLASTSNQMVPVANWAVFAQGGGFKGSVSMFPLTDVVAALKQAYESREAAKAVLYEVTGLGDILRGASDPNETATAQQIKSQWGGLRIRDRQKEVQRFARDILRLNAEILAEQFQPETLRTMSNVPLLMQADKQKLKMRQQAAQQLQQLAQQNPQQAQMMAQANPQMAQMAQPLSMDEMQSLQEPAWEEVVQLLRNQKLRGYLIDVETDSTINVDEQEEKAARTEFLTAVTTAVQAWGPIVMQVPAAAPLFGELLTFAVRAYRTADTLETSIEEMVETLSQRALMPPQQQQAPADPKVEVAREQIGLDRDRMQHESAQTDKEQTLRREEMVHEKDIGQQAIDGEVQKAQATQPKPQDVSAALAPLFELVQAQMQALAQINEQGRQQLAQQAADGQAAVLQALETLMQIASAPKQIKFQRGANNLIEGGTARPVLQ